MLDIRAVIDLHKKWLMNEGGERANLSWADLSGADLRKADLRGANLRGADLRKADLSGADLSGADLRGANLRGANLNGANLNGADLSWANLSWADLSGADLRGANLNGANLNGADLREADLSEAIVPFASSYMDHCNYVIHYRADSNSIHFIAGCHAFNIAEARAHWGDDKYHDRNRGQRMLDTCELLYRWWDSGILPGVAREKD